MRVTFDSNVYRGVVAPSQFPNNPLYRHFETIHRAVMGGSIVGLLCETMATLEAIRRDERADYFSSVRPKVTVAEEEQTDGSIRLAFSIGPNDNTHPGLPSTFGQWLQDAVAVGMRFMRAPRIGLPRTPIPDSAFLSRPLDDSLDRYQSLAAAIESRGVGQNVIKGIGIRINRRRGTPDDPWFRSLHDYRDHSERAEIASAVAEWADGDTVAAHYGYGNDVLCTLDRGNSTRDSVFNAVNRGWLEHQYGISFMSVETLAATIAC